MRLPWIKFNKCWQLRVSIIGTHRLTGGRPEVGDDTREGLADPVAAAQVSPAAPAVQLLPPPVVGLALAELEECGRVREALHDRVHEARVAQVLQPLGVVGQRRRGADAEGGQNA